MWLPFRLLLDFFTVQTLTFNTLYVSVEVDHERRRIRHFNVMAHPTAQWVWRQVIEATPWGSTPQFLIRDRDRSYGCADTDPSIAGERARRAGHRLDPSRVP